MDIEIASIPNSGSGVYFGLTARRDSQGNEYRARLRVTPQGRAHLSAQRVSATGAGTSLGAERTLPFTVEAGSRYTIKSSITGTTSVELKTKVWRTGTAEPGWQYTGADTSGSRLRSAGTVGFWWYVSSSGSNTSATMDNFYVGSEVAAPDPDPAPAPEPEPEPEPAPEPAGTAGARLPVSYNVANVSGTKYFVSTTGNDSASGSQSAPFRTVARALSRVPNGGSATIIVRGGTYREGKLNITNGRTVRLRAYPGEIPTFVGSQSLSSGWVDEGSLSYHSYTPQPVTNASGMSFTSGQGLTGDQAGKYPDQVWIGSQQLRQVASKSSLGAGKFWVDRSRNRVYLHESDQARGRIEVSKLDVFLTVGGKNSLVEGFRVERFSNSADDYGVLKLVSTADGGVVRDVEISDAAFQAVMLAGAESTSGILHDVVMENVTISKANWMGISSNMIEDLTMRRLEITGLNQFKEFSNAPQSGAMKASRNRGVKFLDSVVKDNNGHGVWFDQSCFDIEIAGNEFSGNSGSTVFFEISDRLVLANNYIKSNGDRAVKLAGASGVSMVNNTIVGGRELGVYVDSRSKPGCADPNKPRCSGSSSSDRDDVRPLPDTLDWMPRIDLMINNIIAYPTGTGYCGATTMCITGSNGSATAPLDTVIHEADPSRGIPKTVINGNVYANGSQTVVSTTAGRFSSHSAFGSAMAKSPVSISGIESRGKTGNSWVNSDGSPTAALAARHSEAVAVPNHAAINQYVPAGTRAYGFLG